MEDQIVIFLVSLGLIALGVFFLLTKKSSPKSERLAVDATIVAHTTDCSRTDGSTPGQTTTVSSFPVYEYTVNGQTYRAEGSVGITIFSKDKYQIGNHETIQVDPYWPKRIYTHGERNATAIIGILFIGFGLFTLLFAF